MRILWTRHAEERLKQWNLIRGIARHKVESVLRNPEQLVPGHEDILIAQSRMGAGLLRIPFKAIPGGRKILTVHGPAKW
jgi:hypothetical protein